MPQQGGSTWDQLYPDCSWDVWVQPHPIPKTQQLCSECIMHTELDAGMGSQRIFAANYYSLGLNKSLNLVDACNAC